MTDERTPTRLPIPCNVLGIDLSSKAIDLVLLDENADRASWTRITLEGATAFERARDVAEKMPQPAWYDTHGVFLCAIERPFVSHGQDVIRLVQGCVLAEIPRELHVWEVAVSEWKRHLDIAIRDKPGAAAFGIEMQYDSDPLDWPQDALDALGCALWARDTNAAIVELALARGVADALGLDAA